jgi:hypothetical protein
MNKLKKKREFYEKERIKIPDLNKLFDEIKLFWT